MGLTTRDLVFGRPLTTRREAAGFGFAVVAMSGFLVYFVSTGTVSPEVLSVSALLGLGGLLLIVGAAVNRVARLSGVGLVLAGSAVLVLVFFSASTFEIGVSLLAGTSFLTTGLRTVLGADGTVAS